VAEYGSFDNRAANRFAEFNVSVARDEHCFKLDLRINIAFDRGNAKFCARFDVELFAACSDNCVTHDFICFLHSGKSLANRKT
jgi:hypothetical protein